ncbi:precorrin-2 C20-methyltransferase [Clostridium sp. CAG:1013]|nr:precorrin-2 C20-methyltransferase [Clostridium sp. CAG:1013]
MNTPLHIAPGSADLEEVLQWPGNKILMKSGRQMPEVLKEIEHYGSLSKSSMVQNCGLPEERVFSDLSAESPKETTGYFATVIVKE